MQMSWSRQDTKQSQSRKPHICVMLKLGIILGFMALLTLSVISHAFDFQHLPGQVNAENQKHGPRTD